MMRLKFKTLSILLLAIFICFFIRGHVTNDPDFGWHIQIGNLIAEQGVPKTDPFSYSMPSYAFVDHEWLADVLLAKTYTSAGTLPLQIIFALFGVLVLLILSLKENKKWVSVPIFLVAGTLFESMGIRMQVLSWLFLALLMVILLHKSLWEKWRFVLPVVFALWANLHGGFAFGLVILGMFVVGKSVETRSILPKDYVVLLASIAATLLNPYGYNLWIEVSKSLTDSSLRWSIQEWYPAIYFTNIAFWIYFAISFFLLLRYWRKFSLSVLLIYVVLLFSALSSMRNISLFVIVSFIPTVHAIGYLAQEAARHKYGAERFTKAYQFFFIMSLCLFLPQLAVFMHGVSQPAKAKGFYPADAVSYLKAHPPQGNIFASYDVGGYMIWQYPEKKVFIDGRMPSWRNDHAPANESTYAFGDYKKILTNKMPFSAAAEKYDIDTVLFPKDELVRQKLKILGMDVDKSALLKRFFTQEMSFSYLLPQVKKMGWHEIYRDNSVVIFQKTQKGT